MNILKFKKLIETEKMLNEHDLYINKDCGVIYEVVQEMDSNITKRLPIIPLLIDQGKKEVKFFYDEKIKREFELIEKIATTLAQEMFFKCVVINTSNEMKDKMETLGYRQVKSKTFLKEI
jgi:hypothetical protein